MSIWWLHSLLLIYRKWTTACVPNDILQLTDRRLGVQNYLLTDFQRVQWRELVGYVHTRDDDCAEKLVQEAVYRSVHSSTGGDGLVG